MNRHPHDAATSLITTRRRCASGHATTVWLLVVVAAISMPSCKPKEEVDLDFGFSSGPSSGRDQNDVSRAMGYIDRLDQLDRLQASDRILSHLNRWSEEAGPDPQWLADPMISRLPQVYRDMVPYQRIAERSFTMDDIEFLQEAVWLRDIARWVSERRNNDEFSRFLSQAPSPGDSSDRADLETAMLRLHEDLSPAEAEDLATAVRLFDWTIRNIQLEALLPYPQEVAGPELGQDNIAAAQNSPPPFRAIPGPGYTRHPWQTLLHGSGDSWQRAQVFIHLARQRNIDVVMLAAGEDDTGRPRPRLSAVMIGQRLFLFDTALGLPLPGPEGKGIATLAQAAADPRVLRILDVAAQGDDGEYRYPVSAEQLQKVSALIDASPPYLSQRMKMLQSQLDQEDKMVLATSPTSLAASLRQHPSIESVRLWAVPSETLLYRFARVVKMRQLDPSKTEDRQPFLDFWLGEVIFSQTSPIGKGRRQHFRGRFEPELDNRGAKSWYLQARMSDDMIQRIETDEALQQSIGLMGLLPREPEAREVALQNSVKFFTKTNQSAGYWLALAHYDNGDYANAANWLTRTLDAGSDGTWHAGAVYNLARVYQALGQPEKARSLYLQDRSPLRHGNLIRARWLENGPAQISP